MEYSIRCRYNALLIPIVYLYHFLIYQVFEQTHVVGRSILQQSLHVDPQRHFRRRISPLEASAQTLSEFIFSSVKTPNALLLLKQDVVLSFDS